MPGQRREALLERLAALSQRERDALALRLSDGDRDVARQLVAYVVADGPPPTSDDLADFVRSRLPEYMVPARYVLLDRLPRTSAMKLDRRGVSETSGTDLGSTTIGSTSTGIVAPRNEREELLAEIWRNVLGVEEISVHDDFFELGGDSLLSIRVIARAGRAGIEISPDTFFDGPTIARLAAQESSDSSAEQAAVVGEAPLTPIQEWFFERITAEQSHWNQAVLLAIPTPVEHQALERAVAALVAHHDALRVRFVQTPGGLRQAFDDIYDVAPLRTVDLSGTPEDEHETRIQREADLEHESLDLAAGKLFRVVHFDRGGGVDRVLLVAHHLLVDGVSWGVLLDDLSTLLAQAVGGSPFRLPRKTASALAWAEALAEEARELTLQDAVPWTAFEAPDTWIRVPADLHVEPDANVTEGVRIHSVSLDAAETAALIAEGRGDASAQELLLAALLLAWSRWAEQGGLQLDLEGHGRDTLGKRLDVSRTVGWFTTVFPLTLELPEQSPKVALRAVRTGLGSLPMRGAAHGLLRYLHPDAEVRDALERRPRSEILFNYLGMVDESLPPDSPFELAPETLGHGRNPAAPRAYQIEINAKLLAGSLRLDIQHSSAAHRPESIEDFGAALRNALEVLSDPSAELGGDFELAGLDDAGLDRVADLLAELDQES